ncbi:endolytic transglycosylase MltG [Usitatibacter palustris]|uniref:Endolytic murein transglycosylase n=1 Tax=Usitatibacter palustris TaxID=2732487 RepID=A0A6M4H9X9_9PROT|nr:endolytic transglycosylase MltG [Usitatibacter palustris]QJR15204.1 Endolytic murein transglycosylase [Usitatibacter palustris]
MTIRERLSAFALLLLAAAVATGAWMVAFTNMSLDLPRTPFEFTVKSGSSLRTVARTLSDEGLLPEAQTFWILGRVLGKDASIQAGTYKLDRPVTPMELLEKLARGDVSSVDIAFVEGTTFRQWVAQLKKHPKLKQTLAGKSLAEIAAAAGLAEGSPEGWFFPDTYKFAPGSSDVEILKRAHAAMKKRLADAWDARHTDLPLATPYEALILASIVEKETGAAVERTLVASVFVNRLRKPMRLQTDPTVIYGMGEAFDGNIRKKDLTADTPWNTYTRDGLPPTPIAMPGAASLRAATQPESTEFLYFVGKGDGTHQFSRTLEEHNRAVVRYQLKR